MNRGCRSSQYPFLINLDKFEQYFFFDFFFALRSKGYVCFEDQINTKNIASTKSHLFRELIICDVTGTRVEYHSPKKRLSVLKSKQYIFFPYFDVLPIFNLLNKP